MKVSELMEGKWVRWVAKSLDGKVRRFRDLADAEHWRKNYSGDVTPAKEPSIKDMFDRMDREREAASKANKPSEGEIWRQFENAVANSFPDGDFIDHLAPWLRKHELTMDDVNAAVREYSDSKDAYDYLQKMWDDHAADAEHDALQGAHGETYDDQWFQRPNPWK